MVEYHGWAVIRVSADATEDEPEHVVGDMVQRIQHRIAGISSEQRILGLRCVNGAYLLWAAGYTNHRGADVEEIIAFYSFLATEAPGSYGLLYVQDDEDPQGRDNEFQVWKLARGRLSDERDVFLSPYDPVVEYKPGDEG